MLDAVNADGVKLNPTREVTGFCPLCKSRLIPKIGRCRLPRPHWAHMAGAVCDPWAEHDSETEWHRDWKQVVVPHRREVVLDVGGERHFADIVGAGHTIVEVQRSPITGQVVLERAKFYNNYNERSRLVWVFYATDFASRLAFRADPRYAGRVLFRWKHLRDSHRVAASNARVFWDFGHDWMFKPSCFEPHSLPKVSGRGKDRFDGFGEVWFRYDFMRECLGEAIDWAAMRPQLDGPRPAPPDRPFNSLGLNETGCIQSRYTLWRMCLRGLGVDHAAGSVHIGDPVVAVAPAGPASAVSESMRDPSAVLRRHGSDG